MAAKFIGFHRLIEACDEAGCPACRCLDRDTRRYLTTFLYEHVTDPLSRARLRASWGLCNWHAWMLRETSDPAFGSAVLCEDLLRIVERRLEQSAAPVAARPASLLGRLRERLSRARVPAIVRIYARRRVCRACVEMARAEWRYLETALHFVDDPQFAHAYEASHGLCVPHALGALELSAGDAAGARLLARTLPKWADLRRDLAGFVSKHDHRNRQPFTEAEADAYLRAIETLHGRSGLFPSDRERFTRSSRRARSSRSSR
jgi:hypothetical protein